MENVTWTDDKLNRKGDSIFLTEYLMNKYRKHGTIEGGESFVLNINAEWGFGKTYFLKNSGVRFGITFSINFS